MIGVIGDPEPREGIGKSFGAALFECLLEAGEFIPIACVVLLCAAGLWLVGEMAYHLMFDPNAVDVASRLDALSIDPEKWLPRSSSARQSRSARALAAATISGSRSLPQANLPL